MWGRVMRFLLRIGFWLTVVLVCLPSGGSQPTPKVNVGPVEAISAASAAFSDVKQFCGRQSDACAVGSQVATALGQRAQAGAKMLYEFLNEHVGQNETGTTATTPSGKPVPMPPPRPSQQTLAPADFAPTWRGPQPHKEARRGGPA